MMVLFLIPPLLAALALWAWILVLRRLGVPEGRVVILAFLSFGAVLGLVSALLWPMDLAVYLNLPGTAAGDWVYRFAIARFGDPHSDQAHYSIPWLLRIPQVYAGVTPVVFLLTGAPVQVLYHRLRRNGETGS
jgi:hypothetical protein